MRVFLPSTLLMASVLWVGTPAFPDEKKEEGLTDQQFNRLLTVFLAPNGFSCPDA